MNCGFSRRTYLQTANASPNVERLARIVETRAKVLRAAIQGKAVARPLLEWSRTGDTDWESALVAGVVCGDYLQGAARRRLLG